MTSTNQELIEELLADGVLMTDRIIQAFRRVDRAGFVPLNQRAEAYENRPLPIGFGQTISQPLTVAIMLEALQPQPGERVLDIGAGSGWVSALLADLVGPKGLVIAVERIPALAKQARTNLLPLNLTNLRLSAGDASRGWLAGAPYHVIHVAAAAPALPVELKAQLVTGGRLIIPVGQPVQDLALITKTSENRFVERRIPGFQFVPLISGD